MEVPTGILISFGDEEQEKVAYSPQADPVAPPRRPRKIRSTSIPNTGQDHTGSQEAEGDRSSAGVNTGVNSPPRPLSMPVPPVMKITRTDDDKVRCEMIEEHAAGSEQQQQQVGVVKP